MKFHRERYKLSIIDISVDFASFVVSRDDGLDGWRVVASCTHRAKFDITGVSIYFNYRDIRTRVPLPVSWIPCQASDIAVGLPEAEFHFALMEHIGNVPRHVCSPFWLCTSASRTNVLLFSRVCLRDTQRSSSIPRLRTNACHAFLRNRIARVPRQRFLAGY